MRTADRDREMAEKAFDIAFAGDTDGIDEAMAALFAETRRETLEEAARVAEEMIPLPGSDMQMHWTPAQTLFAAATAIRKLGAE